MEIVKYGSRIGRLSHQVQRWLFGLANSPTALQSKQLGGGGVFTGCYSCDGQGDPPLTDATSLPLGCRTPSDGTVGAFSEVWVTFDLIERRCFCLIVFYSGCVSDWPSGA